MTPHPGAGLRAVIFDLDGTLVDTADDFIPAVLELQREFDREPLPAERIRASVSNGSRALAKLALGIEEHSPEFDARRGRLLELYGEVLGRYARPYPGMRELLATLDRLRIAWGVATNKPRAYTHPLLDTLGIRARSVICPEDVTQTKPHPESLEIACRELECRPDEAVYVGDHARDIEAGRRAGTYTIAAAYGYIEPGDRAEDWGADAIARNSLDLHGLLFNAREEKSA